MPKSKIQKAKQKLTACCLAVMLLLTLLPAAATAETPAAVSLAQAIRIIRENFTIPADCTDFSSGYNSDNNRRVWSLNWNAPQSSGTPGGSFHAEVDADTGEVVNMSCWQPEKQPAQGARIPDVSRSKALSTAADLLKRLAAKRLAELAPVPDQNQPLPLNYGPVTYNFRWQRLVNGIPFPADGVSIGVSGNNGMVVNYSLNWTKAVFPAAGGIISAEKARQVFAAAGMLELQYFRASSIRPLVPQPNGGNAPVKLIYRLDHPSNGVIDALTGKPLIPENGKWIQAFGLPGGKGGAETGRAGQAPAPLTPAEQKEIAKTAGLISQEQAVDAVKKWLSIPENMVLRDASLAVDGQNPDMRIWYLNWNADKTGTDAPQYISARVNALNGELLGFSLSYPTGGEEKPGLMDRRAAQKMAENFLQQIQPRRFQAVKLDDTAPQPYPGPLKKGQNPPFQSFNYVRLVNGIPFPDEGISVTVDTVAQKITSYTLNWSTTDFPSPQGVLNPGQAVDAFLKYRPLTLTYVQVFGASGPEEMRPVYQPLAAPGMTVSNILDAKTGIPLDWQGNPLSLSGALHFKDIAGNFAEHEIDMLGQAGIFGEYGDAFHPGEKITPVSLLHAMLMAVNGVDENRNLTAPEVIARAKNLGWLTEDPPPDGTVSRLLLAKLMVRLLDLDRVARIRGIYVLPYTDARTIAPADAGYVALCRGLGIITGDGAAFNPQHRVTRAEAAAALVRALEAR